LEGLSGASGDNLKVISDGSGGFKFIPNSVYGKITITSNSSDFPVTQANDNSLRNISDYTVLEGTGSTWSPGLTYGTSLSSSGIEAGTQGVYKLSWYVTLSSFPDSASILGFRYVINGDTFGSRRSLIKGSQNDKGTVSGDEIIEMNDGDWVGLAVASTDSGNLVIEDAVINLELVRPT